MRKSFKIMVAVFTLSTLSLIPFSANATSTEESYYDMITPVSSAKVTCDSNTNLHLSGSGGNATNGGVVADPSNANNKCYYMGDKVVESNSWSRGIAFGGDASKNDTVGNRQVLVGKGQISFDLYITRPTQDTGKVTMMYLKDRSGNKLGDIKFNESNGKVQVRGKTANYTNTVNANYVTGSSNTKIEFAKWYTCTISVNVQSAKWMFELFDKTTGDAIQKITFDNFGVTATNVCAVEFKVDDITRPRVYVDNWQTTREAFVIGTPVITQEGNGYTASVTVQNETSTITTPPTLILAVYDETGKLVEVNWDNVADEGFTRAADDYNSRPVLGTTTLSCGVGAGYTAKAYIWNNLSTIVPYILPISSAQ